MVKIRYTAIDYAKLGVVAAIMGVIFVVAWEVYYLGKSLGGPIVARVISYGIWFMAAPLAASLIRKPLSAFLGETLAALVESIIPTAGGFTNLIYGVLQGAASEVGYLAFRYRKWGAIQAALAGAFAGPLAVFLDRILFQEIFSPPLYLVMTLAAMTSGAIYGYVAYLATKAVM